MQRGLGGFPGDETLETGAFNVSRLCRKEVRPVANLIRLRKAHLWLNIF
ncbi:MULTISPECIES: hypothetical protein [unclassified Moorena]|nr:MULTISPECIES: hypothetical protein [unclassified Moorena]NEO15655.1 hypothetical protein [Moorena sp. SIO3E8]